MKQKTAVHIAISIVLSAIICTTYYSYSAQEELKPAWYDLLIPFLLYFVFRVLLAWREIL